ncbi:UvrD-helicase domain-containing protein [Candidatus Microgenomates bacterium]|nr:UvrD-helicase domain-containing protein [Candidatus Microgenomates bacterium]
MKLNAEQQEAIIYQGGPLLIIAGAGTGKTTVITERIKYLILKELAKPAEILALTFTEKASQEMEERVDIAMPYGYTQMWISTFHAFCDRILKTESLAIGLSNNYHLLTEAESTQLLKSHLFSLDLAYFRPLGNPTKFIGGLLQHFSRLQDEDTTPEQYLKFAREIRSTKSEIRKGEEEQGKYLELAKAYQKYQELKVKEGMMDFGDLMINTLAVLRKRPAILQKYQQQFKYILVDEFQDTNISQYSLLKLLAPPSKKPNLTVVGDDSQSIYKFRGAAVSNILQFMKEYKKAHRVVLNKNYRSSQTILDHAHQLIRHNDPDTLESRLGISKALTKVRAVKESEIEFIYADRVENEADEVAKKILELVKSEKRPWSDFSILVRANNQTEPFSRALSRLGMPYQFLGPGQLFRQEEIKDLIAYLKILVNFDDNLSFYRVLSMDYFNISARDIAAIVNYAKRTNLCLFEACEEIDKIFVNPQTREKIKIFCQMFNKHLKAKRNATAGQVLFYFLEDSGMLAGMASSEQSVENQKKTQNMARFFDKLKTYEAEHRNATVEAAVEWIELSLELGESPLAATSDWDKNEAVNILTTHSAKGLEFPVVFLVNLVAGRFPTYERKEQIPIPEELIREELPVGDYHLEEERRLFYVGMTRARDRLYLTAAGFYGEGKRERKISPFVVEALGEKALDIRQQAIGEQLSIFDYAPAYIGPTFQQPNTPTVINYLSYSQIQEFKVCPLHFKLKYILRLPIPTSAAQSFGITMHKTLADFYNLLKVGEKGTLKRLVKIYQDNWMREGYDSKKREELMKEKGLVYLNHYFKNEFRVDHLPILLEYPFTFRLDNNLKVGGKIDRVDKIGRGIEIIDYKTGANLPTDKEVAADLQLTVYALAATEVKEQPFGKTPAEISLSLYFLEGGKKFTTTRTQADLDKAKQDILETAAAISQSDFACSGSFLCQNCEYKMFCKSV